MWTPTQWYRVNKRISCLYKYIQKRTTSNTGDFSEPHFCLYVVG